QFKPVTHPAGQLCYLSTRSVHRSLPLPARGERVGVRGRAGNTRPNLVRSHLFLPEKNRLSPLPLPQGTPESLFSRCSSSSAASGAQGPSSTAMRPARTASNLLRRPAGAVPTTGSNALKQAAPAVSPALTAIWAAVEASISTFCWMAEHPTT